MLHPSGLHCSADLPRSTQRAQTPLPPPPSGPAFIRCPVPADGVVMVSRQRLRVGRSHAGKTVTIVVQDTHYRVLHDDEELSTHPRNSHSPIRTTKAHAPQAPTTGLDVN